MATHANTLKSLLGLFRNRMQIVYGVTEVYKGDVFRNREKLIRLKDFLGEQAERAAKSELARKMHVAKGYYTLEMAPPSTKAELTKLKEEINLAREFISKKGYNKLTVKQAWLMILVGIEVGLWFFLGETIGKFHIVGYKVCP